MIAAYVLPLIVLQAASQPVPVPGAEGLTSVRSERLRDGHVLVLGVDAQRRAVVRVVDPATGRRTEAQGLSPRWFPAVAYVLLQRDQKWYAFHVDTGALEGPLADHDVAARSIRHGTSLDRRMTLDLLKRDSALREVPAVRQALLDRLRLELAQPLPDPSDDAAGKARRGREMDLERLVAIVGQTRMPEAAPLVAAAGVSPGALLDIGKPSIPAILYAWRHVPAGASPRHRFHLMVALRQLIEVFPEAATGEVRLLVRTVLNRPADAESLRETIGFADDLDDAAALRLVQAYAENPAFAAARISNPDAAEAVRAEARRVLARRISIK